MLPLIYTSLLLGSCGEIAGVLPKAGMWAVQAPTGMGLERGGTRMGGGAQIPLNLEDRVK